MVDPWVQWGPCSIFQMALEPPEGAKEFIIWCRSTHSLALITPTSVSSIILVNGRPIVSYLQNFEISPFCSKVVSTWAIVTCREDIKKFFLPHTSSDDLVRVQLENIFPNPCERGAFSDDLSFLLEWEIRRELSSNQLVSYVSKKWWEWWYIKEMFIW